MSHLLSEFPIYSGLAAWSQHYWNLLALETQNYQLQQLVKNHNKPSAIIDDKGHIHYSNVAFNRIADENVELRAVNGIFSLQNKEQQRQLKETLKYLFTRTGLTASVLPGWDNLSSRCTP